jgi:Lrp/AsnC family leucine-responsive transcriptional regulator
LANNLRTSNHLGDAIDVQIVQRLVANARTSIADLARAVGLSAPSVAERMRRLEESGVIADYRAEVDPAALGYAFGAYVRIRPVAGQLRKVADLLRELEQIVECDRITGDDCFIAKVYVGSIDELETLIDRITPFAQTNTSIIQSSPVKRRLVPLRRPPT